jgi:hypothetical protein
MRDYKQISLMFQGLMIHYGNKNLKNDTEIEVDKVRNLDTLT